jgi:hypothetical protein
MSLVTGAFRPLLSGREPCPATSTPQDRIAVEPTISRKNANQRASDARDRVRRQVPLLLAQSHGRVLLDNRAWLARGPTRFDRIFGHRRRAFCSRASPRCFARARTRALRLAAATCSLYALFALSQVRPARADASEIEACVRTVATPPRPDAKATGPRTNQHFEQLTDDQVSELLHFTADSLAKQRLGASLWYSGWVAFNIANVGIGAWKTATVSGHVARDTWMMSTIGASLFLAGASIMPLPGLYANLRLQRLPEATPAQRREKLRQGLLLLERAAQGEELNSNLTAHLSGLAFALFSTGYIYFHNPHADRNQLWKVTGIQFAASVVGAEATLWSVPRKARRDLVTAKEGACGAKLRAKKSAQLPLRELKFSASPAYVGLRLSF